MLIVLALTCMHLLLIRMSSSFIHVTSSMFYYSYLLNLTCLLYLICYIGRNKTKLYRFNSSLTFVTISLENRVLNTWNDSDNSNHDKCKTWRLSQDVTNDYDISFGTEIYLTSTKRNNLNIMMYRVVVLVHFDFSQRDLSTLRSLN